MTHINCGQWSRRLALGTALAISLGFGLVSGFAQDKPTQPDGNEVVQSLVVADSAFERFVDLTALSQAVSSHDTSELADGVLSLMEAERILKRNHHSGVSANEILPAAIRLLAESGDKLGLKRLSDSLNERGIKDFQGQIAAMQNLAGASRATDPVQDLAKDAVDLAAREVIEDLLSQTRNAGFLADKKRLGEIRESVPQYLDLNEKQQQALQKYIDGVLRGIGDNPDPAAQALAKLAGASRTTGTLAISTSDQGNGSLVIVNNNGYRPVAKCNLRNSMKSEVQFRAVGTGKTYTLKSGYSGNFTIYGKIMAQRQSGFPANVISVPGTLAISSSESVATNRVVLPYLEFSSYAAGTHEVAVTDGNFNIVMVRGGIYRLNRR